MHFSKNGLEIEFRYPTEKDLYILWKYINKISQERTFLHIRGADISIEEEEKFLNGELEKISLHTGVLVLCFVNKELIGVCGVSLKGNVEKHVSVLGISLLKDFRGQGIGKALIEHTIKEAKKNIKGIKIITLEVFSKNQVAINLYKQIGFVEYGRLPSGIQLDHEYMDQILMYKDFNETK